MRRDRRGRAGAPVPPAADLVPGGTPPQVWRGDDRRAAGRRARRRPTSGLAGAADLVGGGIGPGSGPASAGSPAPAGPDALAICSVAVPVILASYFTAGWLRHVIAGILSGYAYANPVRVQVESALVVAALVAPPLLGLRWRRTAVAVALALAGWYLIIVFGSLPDYVSVLGYPAWASGPGSRPGTASVPRSPSCSGPPRWPGHPDRGAAPTSSARRAGSC